MDKHFLFCFEKVIFTLVFIFGWVREKHSLTKNKRPSFEENAINIALMHSDFLIISNDNCLASKLQKDHTKNCFLTGDRTERCIFVKVLISSAVQSILQKVCLFKPCSGMLSHYFSPQ